MRNAYYDLWDKDISPFTELREWLHADPQNHWPMFEQKYQQELEKVVALIGARDFQARGIIS